MSSTHWMLDLRTHLSEDTWTHILLGLKVEPFAWQVLHNPRVYRQMLAGDFSSPRDWAPVRIGLVSLREEIDLEALRSDPAFSLPEHWLPIIEKISKGNIQDFLDIDPGFACQVALTAWHLYQKEKKWGEILEFISTHYKKIIHPTLACLVGLLENPAECLSEYICQGEDGSNIADAIQALLANPGIPKALASQLAEIALAIPRPRITPFIRQIAEMRPVLATSVAETVGLEIQVDQLSPSLQTFQSITKQLAQVEYSQVFQKESSQISTLENLLTLTSRLHGEINQQLATALRKEPPGSISPNAILEVLRRSLRSEPANPGFLISILEQLRTSGKVEEAFAWVESFRGDHNDAGIQQELAQLYYLQHDSPKAIEHAIRSLDLLLSNSGVNGELIAEELASLFIKLGMPECAIQAARNNLPNNPLNPRLLACLATARHQIGQVTEALEDATVAYAVHQAEKSRGDKDFFIQIPKLFIETLESAGEWRMALAERQKIIQAQEQVSLAELNGLAAAAIQSGETTVAYQVSRKAIERFGENGESLEYQGKALLEMHKPEEAVQSLLSAIRCSPQQESSWLALARTYQELEQPDKVLETLRAASQAIPDSLLIQLELGEHCARHHAHTQAIPPLEKACRLFKEQSSLPGQAKGLARDYPKRQDLNVRIILSLGKALKSVGRNSESKRILEDGFQSISEQLDQHPDLLQAYAESLQDNGELAQAISVYDCVLEVQPGNLEVMLNLSRALIDIPDQPSGANQAVPLLKKILAESTDELIKSQAQVLLAEGLYLIGELEQAKNEYLYSLKSPVAKSISWQGRIAFGLGKVNQGLNQPEAALAAFLDANKARPEHPQTYRSLAETYLSLNLMDEAWSSARAYIQLRSSDPEAFIWFARLASQIHSLSKNHHPIISEAIHMILKQIQKDPKVPQLWLELGKLLILENDLNAATAAFDQLAEIECKREGDLPLKIKLLYEAGEQLLSEKSYRKSAGYFEMAAVMLSQAGQLHNLETSESEQNVISLVKVLSKESEAFRLAGDYDEAADALRRIIHLQPTYAETYSHLGELLYEVNYIGDAIGCFEKAIELSDSQLEYYLKIIWLHTTSGDLPSALEAAEKGLHHAESNHNQMAELQLRYLAAEIARSLLEFDRASEFLTINVDQAVEAIADDIQLLKHEIQLEKKPGNHPDSQNQSPVSTSALPRSKALRARLSPESLSPDLLADLSVLVEEQLNRTSQPSSRLDALGLWKNLAMLRSLAEAALTLENWEASIRLFECVVQQSPHEPFALVRLARAYVVRAEKQNFSAELDRVHNTPGKEAISQASLEEFNRIIEKAYRRLNDANHAEIRVDDYSGTTPQDQIGYWRERGLMAFVPSAASVMNFQNATRLYEDEIHAILLAKRMIRDDSETDRLAHRLPAEKQPCLLLALVYEQTRPWEALEIACQAIEKITKYRPAQDSESALWYFLLSRLTYHTGGQNRLGISITSAIEKSLSYFPQEPRWHAIAAEYYLHDPLEKIHPQNKEKAEQHLATAIQLEPDYAYHLYAMADLRRSEGDNESAIHYLIKASELAPLSADIRLLLAKIQYEQGDLDSAAKNAEMVIDNSPDPVDALLLRGEIALLNGNPRDAQNRAQSILKLMPDHLEALQLYARSLNALDRPEEALEIMAKVIPQVEKPLPLELERAEWFCEAEPTTEAVVELRSLIQRYPQVPLFKAYLAEVLDRQNLEEAAIMASRQALQDSDLGLPNEIQAKLHLIIGKNMHKSGQLDNAIYHLSQSVEKNPANLEAYLELGQTYQTRRNYQEAARAYQNAIHIAPQDYRPYYHAGLAFKEAKDYQSSEAMLRKAVEYSSGEINIRRQLGAVIALNFVHNRRASVFPSQTK